eukprot:CAMPEP_0170486778 /NCGR_PEP_ID=MMETSP0208-20121228/5708_1 /TAXON_ID=197538 /ORGANISM="Strombidium inclinatum, Strain S3" /LENGTH=65 /DNA_ID=CAMNT_0010760817 /DNA_START=732 /DNA_END=926 /DNA_ORIENTATION=-
MRPANSILTNPMSILQKAGPSRPTITRKVRPVPVKPKEVKLPSESSLAGSQEMMKRVFRKIELKE